MACEATRADSEYDWKDVAVALSASNARLCEIALEADKLRDEVEAFLTAACSGTGRVHRSKVDRLIKAYEAYCVVRSGQ